MQMKTKLKALASAVSLTVGLTVGLGAQAALISNDNIANVGLGSGAGSLVLAMVDLTANKSLVFNTGLSADSFNSLASASFNVAIQSGDLAKINAFIGGATDKSKVKWNISAIDNRVDFTDGGDVLWNVNGFQFTAPSGTTVAQTLAGGPTTGDAINTGVMTNMANDYFNLQNALSGANSLAGSNNVAVVAADGPAGFGTRNWGSLDLGLRFDTTGVLGSSLDYFFFHGTGVNDDTGLGKVGSDKYAGQWTLNFDAAGTSLAYSVPAAVPVPPALLLMGSAIAGLGAARRRKSA